MAKFITKKELLELLSKLTEKSERIVETISKSNEGEISLDLDIVKWCLIQDAEGLGINTKILIILEKGTISVFEPLRF